MASCERPEPLRDIFQLAVDAIADANDRQDAADGRLALAPVFTRHDARSPSKYRKPGCRLRRHDLGRAMPGVRAKPSLHVLAPVDRNVRTVDEGRFVRSEIHDEARDFIGFA
jgi:hypothetical protein